MTNSPKNKALYARVKSEAKRKFKVWPSAYASGWLVKEYKRRGGTYQKNNSRSAKRPTVPNLRSVSRSRSRKSGSNRRGRLSNHRSAGSNRRGRLSRWFEEKWIDVCKLPRKVACGRAKSSRKNYPYCRPSKRVSKSTPKTARELTKSEIQRRCKQKRKYPMKKVMGKRVAKRSHTPKRSRKRRSPKRSRKSRR
jgi:hypothetical protein